MFYWLQHHICSRVHTCAGMRCGGGRERAVTGDSAGIKMSLSGDGGPLSLSMNESQVF